MIDSNDRPLKDGMYTSITCHWYKRPESYLVVEVVVFVIIIIVVVVIIIVIVGLNKLN